MFIFGKLFTTTEAAIVLTTLILGAILAVFIIMHVIADIRREKQKRIIYLYQTHYEVRRK